MATPSLPQLFPPELLTAPLERRMRYFTEEAVVEHPRQTDLINQLLVLTAYPTARNLILVIGPTGAGKSTLLRHLNKRINAAVGSSNDETGQIGSIYLELETPGKGAFDYKEIYSGALTAMGAPLVGMTRPIVVREVGGLRIPTLLVERDSTELRGRGLKQRFYEELRRRKPAALMLDEARALFAIGRPKNDEDRLARLKVQADLAKNIANTADLTLVLGGSFDFFDLSHSSAQNARRSLTIHVRPYGDQEADCLGFASAALGLISHLPIEHTLEPALVAIELKLQSLGCVGTAAGILADALREAIHNGVILTMDLLRKHYYPAAALTTMRAELAEGMGRVDKMLSLEDLAGPGKSPPPHPPSSPAAKAPKLKPGETKPSNMAGMTKGW